MDKANRQVLDRVNKAWERLMAVVARVPASRMEEPGTLGTWSVQDLLGHISTWEFETVQAVRDLMRGEPPPAYDDVEAFNAREAERKRGLPLERVREELVRTHEAVTMLLEHLPAELLVEGSPGRKRVAGDTYEHYDEHSAQLERWLGTLKGR